MYGCMHVCMYVWVNAKSHMYLPRNSNNPNFAPSFLCQQQQLLLLSFLPDQQVTNSTAREAPTNKSKQSEYNNIDSLQQYSERKNVEYRSCECATNDALVGCSSECAGKICFHCVGAIYWNRYVDAFSLSSYCICRNLLFVEMQLKS